MLYPDIIIPTCKPESVIQKLIGEISFICRRNEVIATCSSASAAVNRNLGLKEAMSPIIVMMDDDISGFYPGWAEKLIQPLIDHTDIVYVSARLLDSDGKLQNAMGASKDVVNDILDVSTAPSACVAFRQTGVRFDEHYVGSGWEDTDFVKQLKQIYPHGRIVINNCVRMTHANEMKNQLGENFRLNRAYYNKKWGTNE
jgi:glycosyltransferase involved in cell wall biosynthesis